VARHQGAGGSTAWTRDLVEFGLQWEIDAREIPPDWTTGYLGIDTTSPTQKPPREYRTEVFQLNEALLRKAYALSRDAPLADSAQAQAARAKFNHAPASQPSSVLQCDTASGDTWFSGSLLTQRARDWTRILTDGKGVFCTAQQEDNAIYEALKRGASARLLDLDRVAVLRAGSDFLQPYDGQSSADNLVNYAAQGGFPIALENLYRTGNPLVQQIVDHWRTWRRGVPAH
jgi:purine nucleoside permease